jgi:transposase-like protein
MLRAWKRQRDERAGAAAADVFPGNGRLPSEEDEVRRLTRELARAQQEIAFLKSAAAYFARESR